jgi:hypothetical protein
MMQVFGNLAQSGQALDFNRALMGFDARPGETGAKVKPSLAQSLYLHQEAGRSNIIS